MGFWQSKPKKRVEQPPEQPRSIDPEDAVLNKIRKTLSQDLETFLLNNILLSVQFFDNFEREVTTLRKTLASEGDAERNEELAEHQRHCVSPDRLCEAVRRRVLFRPEHGERRHSYEPLHSPRLFVVQDNVEVVEHRDASVYSTVVGTPSYRFTMEKATKSRPGYVKIRAEECMLPHRRRTTYENIKDEDEGVYTSISSHSPEDADGGRSVAEDQDGQAGNSSRGSSDLTENCLVMMDTQKETESAGKAPPFSGTRPGPTKRVFGPQHPDCDPNKGAGFTPTERRLSGILRGPRHVDTHMIEQQEKLSVLKAAQSLPNLAVTDNAKTTESPKNSDSSGYKSEGGFPSHSNSTESEYAYTTITQLTTPRPLKERRLGHVLHNTSEIPQQCFHAIDVAVYDDDDDDDDDDGGNYKIGKKLFETRYYLNSILFMRGFADVFSERLGVLLGFTSGLDSATLQGTKIYCETIHDAPDSRPIKIRNEIIPTIFSAIWPKEALKWKVRPRNRVLDPRPDKVYTWPTEAMLDRVHSLGCHLLPLGYMPTRGRNKEQFLQWQLAFPEAERYLETSLTHAQVRCLLFSMALYKSFLEPLNMQLGLLPKHIRTLLFWQCEQNYAAWPDDRPGQTLRKFLDKMYDAIMRKNLPDYFIQRRNLFESTPSTHLLKVQEKLLRIKENLVMHTLLAVRNLRYVGSSFYPVFDCKRLYHIITTDNLVTLLNPLLQKSALNTITPKNIQNEQEDSDEETGSNFDLWKPVTSRDPKKKWKQDIRTQIEIERSAQKADKTSTPMARRPSTDSIDIKLQPKKGAEDLRKMALLDFFIPHFIAIAKKSDSLCAIRQSRFYLRHAERLVRLLRECGDVEAKAQMYSAEIKTLREGMSQEALYATGTVSSTSIGTPSKLDASSGALVPEGSVHYVKGNKTQPMTSQGAILKNVNPFREKMELPHDCVPSTLTKPAIVKVPLSRVAKCDEQSNSQAAAMTVAQVHQLNSSVRNHGTRSRPEISTDVKDSRPPSSAFILNEVVTAESADF